MTQILPANEKEALKIATRLLREGEVVVFPTDTVYGIGGDAFQRIAVRQIYEVKQRPPDKALPVFIAEVSDLNLVANVRRISDEIWLFLERFWPGALTVVLPKAPPIFEEVTAGTDTIAVRIPDHSVCLDLVRMVGRPLAVTSANVSGQPTPQRAHEVARQFNWQLPIVLDGGLSPGEIPSTIVDFTTSQPRILRQGVLPFEMLREALPDLVGASE